MAAELKANPPPTGRAPPAATPRQLRWAAAAVVAFVVAMIAVRWRAGSGFTNLIHFGEEFAERQLPDVRALPVALAPHAGYDGQFYAQLAVHPDVARGDVWIAIDNLRYRGRRILLPGLAHLLGLGRPWLVLQVYALLNLAAWLALARIWWLECAPHDGAGFARWCAGVLALGALDSVRMALTDVPATLLLVLAVRGAAVARPRLALAWLALGGLTRETTLLALRLLEPARPDASADRGAWLRACVRAALAVLPFALWLAWLYRHTPAAPAAVIGNIGWPGVAWARHVFRCGSEIAAGNFDSRYTFGLVAALGLAWQSLFWLARWRHRDAWTRAALPFAILFWLLGDYVWHGYWAAARACLPMTFAFARVAPLRASFVLANLFALHGVYRLLPDW